MTLVLVDTDDGRGHELQRRLVALGHEAQLAATRRDALAAIHPSTTKVVLIGSSKLGYKVGNLLRNRREFHGVRLLMYGPLLQNRAMKQHARLPTRADGYLTLPTTDSELQEAVVSVSQMAERSELKPPPPHALLALLWVASLLSLAVSAVLGSVGHVLHKAQWRLTESTLMVTGLIGYAVAEGGALLRRGSLPRWRVGVLVLIIAYLMLRAVGWLLK